MNLFFLSCLLIALTSLQAIPMFEEGSGNTAGDLSEAQRAQATEEAERDMTATSAAAEDDDDVAGFSEACGIGMATAIENPTASSSSSAASAISAASEESAPLDLDGLRETCLRAYEKEKENLRRQGLSDVTADMAAVEKNFSMPGTILPFYYKLASLKCRDELLRVAIACRAPLSRHGDLDADMRGALQNNILRLMEVAEKVKELYQIKEEVARGMSSTITSSELEAELIKNGKSKKKAAHAVKSYPNFQLQMGAIFLPLPEEQKAALREQLFMQGELADEAITRYMQLASKMGAGDLAAIIQGSSTADMIYYAVHSPTMCEQVYYVLHDPSVRQQLRARNLNCTTIASAIQVASRQPMSIKEGDNFFNICVREAHANTYFTIMFHSNYNREVRAACYQTARCYSRHAQLLFVAHTRPEIDRTREEKKEAFKYLKAAQEAEKASDILKKNLQEHGSGLAPLSETERQQTEYRLRLSELWESNPETAARFTFEKFLSEQRAAEK